MIELLILTFAILSIYSSIKETALKNQEKINNKKRNSPSNIKKEKKIKYKKKPTVKNTNYSQESKLTKDTGQKLSYSPVRPRTNQAKKPTNTPSSKAKPSPSFQEQYDLKNMMLSYEIMSGPKALRNKQRRK